MNQLSIINKQLSSYLQKITTPATAKRNVPTGIKVKVKIQKSKNSIIKNKNATEYPKYRIIDN